MRDEWYQRQDGKRARLARSTLLKLEFSVLLTLVLVGLAASLLSAIGVILGIAITAV